MAELVGPRVYSCSHCRNHVCLHDDIISKAFQVVEQLHPGKDYLFVYLVNNLLWPPALGEEWPCVSLLPRHERYHGAKEDRQLMTGLHTVADIHCRDCREVLGWKYERAYEESQKYKEGKFIFEKAKIVQENW
ncbi:protein yippee-like [Hordeum vulgare]|nr:protein yippee-like [Hordeum vulgare]